MNNRLSLEFGQSHVRIPLEDAPHILNGDALETGLGEPSAAGRLFLRIRQSAVRRSRSYQSEQQQRPQIRRVD